jgi:hypothetical protein
VSLAGQTNCDGFNVDLSRDCLAFYDWHVAPLCSLLSVRYDTNPQFYASKTFLDSRTTPGRRVLWGWLWLFKSGPEAPGGWQGAQGVPRVVEAASDGRSVVTYPLPELNALRDEGGAVDASGLTLSNASSVTLLGLRGQKLDIEATITFIGTTTGDQVLDGVDLRGGDYGAPVDLQGEGFGACRDLCTTADRCKAWTFVAATSGALSEEGKTGGRCFLKGSVPSPFKSVDSAASTFPKVTSGVKGGGSALSCGFKVLADPSDPSGEGTLVTVNVAAPSAASFSSPSSSSGDGRGGRRSHNVEIFGQSGVRDDGAGGVRVGVAGPGNASFVSGTVRHLSKKGSKVNGDGDESMVVTVRLLVDASIVESFVDGGASANTALPGAGVSSASMDAVYAVSQLTAAGIASMAGGGMVVGSGGSCAFTSLKAWPVAPFQYDTSLCVEKGCLYP